MEAYVYLITCTVNGRRYVGSTTTTLANRFANHISNSKRSYRKDGEVLPMYKDMNEHSREAFTIVLLETVPRGRHKEREQHWINELDTCSPNEFGHGYNTRWAITKQPFKDYHRQWSIRRVVCSCGKEIAWGSKTKHERTKSHQRDLAALQEVTVE